MAKKTDDDDFRAALELALEAMDAKVAALQRELMDARRCQQILRAQVENIEMVLYPIAGDPEPDEPEDEPEPAPEPPEPVVEVQADAWAQRPAPKPIEH